MLDLRLTKEGCSEDGADGLCWSGSGTRLTVGNLTAKLRGVNPLLNTEKAGHSRKHIWTLPARVFNEVAEIGTPAEWLN